MYFCSWNDVGKYYRNTTSSARTVRKRALIIIYHRKQNKTAYLITAPASPRDGSPLQRASNKCKLLQSEQTPTTLSLHRFLGTQLNTIFHSDSSNYYRSPLSFSWHFPPDIPSIINCHIMKLQQRMVFIPPLSSFLLSQHYSHFNLSSNGPNYLLCVVARRQQACLIREIVCSLLW